MKSILPILLIGIILSPFLSIAQKENVVKYNPLSAPVKKTIFLYKDSTKVEFSYTSPEQLRKYAAGFQIQIGDDVNIADSVSIKGFGEIKDGVYIGNNTKIFMKWFWIKNRVIISSDCLFVGDELYVDEGSKIFQRARTSIKNFIIGSNVVISPNFLVGSSTYFIIRDRVRIGSNVIMTGNNITISDDTQVPQKYVFQCMEKEGCDLINTTKPIVPPKVLEIAIP